ncbi:MAG TPA: hypothetical protein VFU23_00510, partial [Gemmatimonadales bacterium]|nr:hypothetical protein [Gemmatimonadales bacterium]
LEPGYELHGRDSLRSLLKTVTVTTAFAGFVMEPEQYVDGTAQVAEFGRYRETMRDRKTGAETVCDCRYAVVWTKEADGVWRISRLHGGQSRLGPQ